MKNSNSGSVDSIILIVALVGLAAIVGFLATGGENNNQLPTGTLTFAPTASTEFAPLPTLPATNPSPTPEKPDPFQSPLPLSTPKALSPRPTALPPLPSDPYLVRGTGTRDTFDPEIIAQMSSIVIVGSVKEVLSARWTTVDGQRPENPHIDDINTIYTPILIQVETVVKGLEIQPQLLLYAWGGTVDKDVVTWVLDDMYTFKQGDHVVVFLNPREQLLDGTSLWTINEHYTVRRDGKADNGYHILPLQDLIDKVKSSVQVQ